MACIAVPGAIAVEWRTVKKKPPTEGHSTKQAAEKGPAQNSPNENGVSKTNARDEEEIAATAADDKSH
ncbi:hypothetical protein VP1G_11137 [Cytospora mali]|uniref:Uncharacterized protein n=1 Tax=Cytospora mali TaxID=578113 RepID=A0A194V8Y7_CYTMA|nr:hypothetical protein VP1G_11137 [Valsa mali var. pyri (nom. inval.)]